MPSIRAVIVLIVLVLSAGDGLLGADPPNFALRFDGVNDYVTFGNPSALRLQQFTLELWFRRDGTGVTTSTGTGGVNAEPLVAKGRGEVDGDNRDMNYFLGLEGTTRLLAADFEDTATGANHRVIGKTCICDALWHHAAATFDGSTWRLYLDGVVETTLAVGGFTPRFDSIQRASIASAQTSTGAAAGFFKGAIDEVRIWNYARAASDVASNRSLPIASATGLVGRWGLNEGTGTTAADSSGSGVTGTARNGPVWIAGAPLNTGSTNQAPVVNAGPDVAITLPAGASLSGIVTDDVPASVTSNWTKVSGPGTVSFANAAAPATTATFSIAGTYVLRLTAGDGQYSSSDDASVQVAPAAPVNHAPTVDAGADTSITLPGLATLNGSASDDGLPGGPLAITWRQTSGPGSVTFGNTSAASTTASFSQAGTYVLTLTADDGALSTNDVVTVTANAPAGANTALAFPGTGAYVTFGQAALGASQFTLEAWFRRLGTGQTTSTGTGGVTAAPIVAKGRSESDGSNKDENYFFGIDASGHLVADFEEGASGASPGLNHPIVGSTTVVNDTWYHAAVSYDGVTWRLYLNGQPDGQLTVNRPVRSDSIQHASIGTAMNSTGVASGFFNGVIDEVRIWNMARSAQDILANVNTPIVSAPNLIGRWGLNEAAGTVAGDSSGRSITGTIVGTNWSWVSGAPFSLNTPPDAPLLAGPLNGSTGVSTSPTLDVRVSDGDQDQMTVTFYGRAVPPASPDFTLGVIPDTQHYVDSANYPTFTAQTQWLVANRNALNLAFVTHLGDIAQNIDAVQQEWIRADTSMKVLDDAGVEYNVSPGNHDISAAGVAAFYDQYFPVSRFLPKSSYGGWLGKEAGEINRENKDNYELFSVGSLDFLVVHLEMDIPDYSLAWADKILKRYPNRRAIVSTHIYLDTTATRRTSPQFRSNGTSAENVWQQLIKPNCNVFLVVNGHYHGEARRTDLNNCGQPVHQVVQDYQDFANGGDGWLRYYTFKPAQNRINVYTYSPTRNGGLGEYDTDAQSQFTLDYTMQGTPFAVIGSTSGVASGTGTTKTWTGLAPATKYEWYVTVSDGKTTTVGPTWTFTTQ
jgi:hypothetical protein